MDNEILSVKDVAQMLGSTEGSVRKMAQQNRLPYYKPFGKLLFKRSDIMNLITAAYVPSAKELINSVKQ